MFSKSNSNKREKTWMVVFWYTNWKKNYLVLLCLYFIEGFPGDSAVENLLAMQEMQKTWVRSLSLEDPLEQGMATPFSILAWRIHGQRGLVGYSPWDHSQTPLK